MKALNKKDFHKITGGNRYANLKNDISVRIQSLPIFQVIFDISGYVKPHFRLR